MDRHNGYEPPCIDCDDDGFAFGQQMYAAYDHKLKRMDASLLHRQIEHFHDGIYIGKYSAGLWPTHEPIEYYDRIAGLAPYEQQAREQVFRLGHLDTIDYNSLIPF